MAVRQTDPGIAYAFQVDFGGMLVGMFTEVSGLGSETEVIEHKVVDENGNDLVQILPGRLKYNAISLKRGITTNMDAWDWRKMVEDGNVDGARMNGSIIMLDQSGNPMARWDVTGAWPSKCTGPQFQSDSNSFAVEEMEIRVETCERVAT